MNESATTTADLDGLLEGLEYSAVFVPFSHSRNATDTDPSLNWKVTVSAGRQTITTDYMQGIGHLPEFTHKKETAGDRAYYRECAEAGRYCPKRKQWGSVRPMIEAIPAPSLKDVMYSLIGDSDVLEFACWADWADEFGYDEDSRKAEAIYQDCMKIALVLRAMLGNARLELLRKAFQDY